MNGFWNYWNSLSPELRNGIVGGIISTVAAAAILGALKLSGISIRALFKRFASPPIAPVLTPATPPIIVNVPSPTIPLPTPSPETSAPTPLIPKSPAVGFVARRDKEGRDILELLKESLAPGGNQLIALWGEGGIGKTTLAAEASRALSADYQQRVVWVSADKRADFLFSTFLDEIATRLNRPDVLKLAIVHKIAEVQSLIAAQPTLVVLDNFETIASEERERCAEFLEHQSPHAALITTREMVMGARNILIDAMSPAEAKEFLSRLVKQSPEPNAFVGLQLEQIIQVAAANPLAMEWVVAQINLAQKPSDVLNDLAEGEGDAAQHVFDRSFKLPQLGDDGRAVLLALSLFVPSASRAALAEVAGFRDVEKRLNEAARRLAALRLLRMAEGGGRLLIQGLTRELAKSHLTKDEQADEYRRRFVAHFLGHTQSNSEPTAQDYDALEVEKDNILSAIDWAFSLEDWDSVQALASILAPVTGMLSVRGYWDEAIRTNEQGLKAARIQASQNGIAVFTHNLAVIHGNRGNLVEARRLYDESLAIEKKLGNQSGIASSLHQLGRLAEDEGDHAKAAEFFAEALKIFEKLESPNAEIARRSLARVQEKLKQRD